MRVLYYTNVPLHESANGGNICCRNHVQRLSEEPELEVFAVVTQEARCEAGTTAFLNSLGVPSRFVPYLPVKRSKSRFRRFWKKQLGYLMFPGGIWRQVAMKPTHVQQVIDEMIIEWNIEAMVIDYYLGVVHIRLPRHDVRTCIIKLNREAEFYWQQMKYTKSWWYCLTHQIEFWRLKLLERKIDNSVGKVVVIGAPDIPPHVKRSPPVCITPYLDRAPVQWSYSNSKSIFFVGSILHYPNKLAVEWILNKLGPEMAKVCPEIVIKIVGCSSQDAAELGTGAAANISFLGVSDRESLEHLFCHADLMLCPIENNFGMKFKSAEAIAYGIPLLASVQTLLGLPYLKNSPSIHLDKPAEAAILIRDLTANGDRLLQLSASQKQEQDAFIKTQKNIWKNTLMETPIIPAKN